MVDGHVVGGGTRERQRGAERERERYEGSGSSRGAAHEDEGRPQHERVGDAVARGRDAYNKSREVRPVQCRPTTEIESSVRFSWQKL